MSSLFHRWSKTTATIKQGYGQCFRKGAYKTQEIAEHYRTKSEAISPGIKLYIYQCKICKKFHLTKKKQEANE